MKTSRRKPSAAPRLMLLRQDQPTSHSARSIGALMGGTPLDVGDAPRRSLRKRPLRLSGPRLAHLPLPRLTLPRPVRGRAGRRKGWNRQLLGRAALALAVLVAVSGASVGVAVAVDNATVAASSVVLGGEVLGSVSDPALMEQALAAYKAELEAQYGLEVVLEQEVSYDPVRIQEEYLCTPEQLQKQLQRYVKVKVMAQVIYVNDRPAVGLTCAEDCQAALEQVRALYQTDKRQRDGIEFVENVQVAPAAISPSQVVSVEEAVTALTLGQGVSDHWYKVQPGDTLLQLALDNGIRLDDIRKANPDILDVDMIDVGQDINLVAPKSYLNVRYVETVTRTEAIDFETEVREDNTLLTTQRKVAQEGKKGERQITARVSYVNGREVAREVVSETVTQEPVKEIVLKGTKKVSNTSNAPAQTGQTTGGYKYPLPLTSGSYRISSRFGARSLGYHKGVDLAAPIGTPIYASRAGTVTYSGSASGYGLVIYLDHGGGVQTRYGHCSKLLVKSGARVQAGQLIALVGNTGRSTGPHCHFEVRINGTAVDPLKQ